MVPSLATWALAGAPSYFYGGTAGPVPRARNGGTFGLVYAKKNPWKKSLTSASDPEKPKLTIQERIKDLNEALATSEFEPERVNIKAAIDAYESGEVGYTRDYTLIWAGQVVDTAATYGAFSQDRAERLDRYAEKYGPHWLWWESPLDLHPQEQLQAKGCQIIPRKAQKGGLGHFYIHQV